MTATKLLFIGAAALLLPVASQSRTIPYPGEFASLNEALQAASAGDTVLVAPGSYQESVRMKSGVVLRSSAGRDSTTLISPATGQDPLNERMIEAIGLDSTTVIEGLTLDHGKSFGAGIYCEDSKPTIRRNIIRGFGWGINLRQSSALIVDNVIEQCTTFGVLIVGCSPTLHRNEIRNNGAMAIEISGNKSAPEIGGKKENANKFYGNQAAIRLSGRRDLAVHWNDWGWETTEEMEREGYPSDIISIVDGNDFAKTHRGRGKLDYRHWIKPPHVKQASAPPPSGPPAASDETASGNETASARRYVPWGVGAALVGILVALAAKRKRARSSERIG